MNSSSKNICPDCQEPLFIIMGADDHIDRAFCIKPGCSYRMAEIDKTNLEIEEKRKLQDLRDNQGTNREAV